MSPRRVSIGSAFLIATACGGATPLDRFTPADADSRSREYLSQFTRAQIDSVTARVVPPLQTPEAATQLQKITDILRNERFDTIRVIGAQTNIVNGVRHVNLTYELHSSFSWFLANVATLDSADTWFVEGVSARTITQPLEIGADFSLRGKSALHYFWLFVTVVCATASFGAAMFLATRREMPKRWRWVLASFLGVGAFQLNWETGTVGVQLVRLQLASASFLRAGPAAPWMLAFSIPLGAFFALRAYRRWDNASAPGHVGQASAPEAAV